MPFDWKSLQGFPLVTFFVQNNAYTYCDDGTLSAWNASRTATTPYSQPARNKSKIEPVDRLIFHDTPSRDATKRGAFLTGFNVIGDSYAEYQRGSLLIYTSIRCMLQSYPEGPNDPYLGEAVSIQAEFDTETLQHLWISHRTVIDTAGEGSVDLVAPAPGSRAPRPLKQVLSDMASGRIPPVHLGLRKSSAYTGIYPEWSHMLRGLLAFKPGKQSIEGHTLPDNFPKTVQSDIGLTVSFRDDQNLGQYLIEFEASFLHASAQGIQCFSIRTTSDADEEEARFQLANGADWYFRQRSSVRSSVIASRAELDEIPEWTLELQCLSHESTTDRLSHWTQSNIDGIHKLSGGTSASFLPRLVPPARGNGLLFCAIYQIADRWMNRKYIDGMLYDSTFAVPQKTVVRPLSVQFVGHRPAGQANDSTGSANLVFPLCTTTAGGSLTETVTLFSDKMSNRDSLDGFNFFSQLPLQGLGDTHNVRMGSLELMFGSRPIPPGTQPRDIYFRLPATGEISINAWFSLNGLLPGGQDDLPDDSFAAPNAEASAMPICRLGRVPGDSNDDEKLNIQVENLFYRPKPLLINRNNSSIAPLLFQVNEQAGPAITHTVQLSVTVDVAPAPVPEKSPQQTIVIDADPFLVAQISFPQLLAKSNVIASWLPTGPAAGSWQIPLTTTGFTMTVPSQVMGEEMVKGKQFAQPPIDFRLGPPAVISMESGPQRTNYAEVPWNLRRILSYPSETSPGVQVNRLDYELLYGLSCDASLPFVRLAEVFALFGAIPGRISQELATPSDPSFGPPHNAALYHAVWRTEWAKIYGRYQSRLAVLEPQDSHVSGSLTIKHGMGCVIRYNVDHAQQQCSVTLGKALLQFAPDDSTDGHPFRLPYADLDDPITPAPRGPAAPLRGGVTWGFESRNIFCATLRDRFSTADSAAVSDLDFTALGAFGHQQASFDEGRTAIFGDVSLGRTYYYKLERVGRIAVFWNKAKHVIVYERSVVPSRQFYLEQNPDKNPTDSYGIPILRKVEEYIEILEEERRFPDDHVLGNVIPTTSATPAERCGCVSACLFQKGARIKVSSAWGSDVNSYPSGTPAPVGWKIPLWKRGAQPEDVYPFPKISLSLFSDFGGSSKESPCDIANPESVYFYTDTREGTGSDTDKWVAILGVDTVDMPALKPPQSSTNGVLPAVGDVPVPAGFSPCTFKLLPPLRATNIVANRVGTTMAVSLDSVTMMRGCTAPKPVENSALSLTNVIDIYASRWETELQKLTPQDWSQTRLLAAADRISIDVNNAANIAQTAIKAEWQKNWTAQVQQFNNTAFARLQNQLRTGTSDGNAIVGGIQQVQRDVSSALSAISATPNPAIALQQLVEQQFGAIQKAVLDASATPGIVTTVLTQYYVAVQGVVTKAANGIKQINDALTSLPSDAQDAVGQLTRQLQDLRVDLTATWSAAATSRPLPQLTDVSAGLISGPLKTFAGQYTALIAKLTATASSQVADYNQRLTDLKKNIPSLKPFDAAVTAELGEFAAILRAGLPASNSNLISYLDYFRNDLTFIDPGGATWAGTVYQQLVAAVPGGAQAVQKAFNDTFTGFDSKLTMLQKTLTNELQSLNQAAGGAGKAITDAFDQISASASSTLTNLKSSLAAALQNLPAVAVTPQEIADMQKAVLQFRDAQLAEAHQYADTYLGVFRAAAADVTSNTNQLISLVRCFGDAPIANTLSFLPGKIGYYFQGLPTQVDLSPVTSILQQAGNVATDATGALNNALSVMHLQVPAVSLGDRLIPPDLSAIKLSDIFPKFSGIDLSQLFQGINLNETGDKIRISHGTDPQTTSAWVQADIGAHLQDVPVFETAGIALRLQTADFAGQVRLDVSPQGTRQAATGKVLGDWALLVLGQTAVTLAQTELLFDNSGKLQFKVDPKNVRLPSVLDFVTQYLAPFLDGGNGLSVQVQGTQVLALLRLPIPDVSGLTSGISNLSLSCRFGVGLVNGKFQLDVGFGLSDPRKPFNVAFFILGGSGYLTATTSFVPASGAAPTCSVDFGIMASASLAIAFGPISGGVYAFLGIRAGFSTGGLGLSLSAVLILRGQVNLAGIISASVCMELAATYDGHQLTGTGYFSISVTICWCFTLNISVGITYPIGSFSGQSLAELNNPASNEILVASLQPVEFDPHALGTPGVDELSGLIDDYVAMTKGF